MVLHVMVPDAERAEVVAAGVSAVFPCGGVVVFAAGGGDVASGGHAPGGSPFHEPPQIRRWTIRIPPDGQNDPGFGVGEDSHPAIGGAAEFAGGGEGDRTDPLDRCRFRVAPKKGEDGTVTATVGRIPRAVSG